MGLDQPRTRLSSPRVDPARASHPGTGDPGAASAYSSDTGHRRCHCSSCAPASAASKPSGQIVSARYRMPRRSAPSRTTSARLQPRHPSWSCAQSNVTPRRSVSRRSACRRSVAAMRAPRNVAPLRSTHRRSVRRMCASRRVASRRLAHLKILLRSCAPLRSAVVRSAPVKSRPRRSRARMPLRLPSLVSRAAASTPTVPSQGLGPSGSQSTGRSWHDPQFGSCQ